MISIKNVTKEFSGQKVLDGIDIDIEKGEVVALVGASGAGKSTILRCLNYLEQPDSGTIAIDDFKVSRLLRNFLTTKLPRLLKKSSLRLGFLIVKITTHVTCRVVKSNVWLWLVPLQ